MSLSACKPSGAQSSPTQPGPTEQDVATAYFPGHVPAKGSRSECFGRLVFEVSAKPSLEWGLPKGRSNDQVMGFSRVLQGGQDLIRLANVAVVVVGGATSGTIQEMQRLTGVDKNLIRHRFDENIRVKNLSLEGLIEDLDSPELKADAELTRSYQQGIQEKRQQIESYKLRKQNLDKDWHPTDWGLPDSLGYIAGPTLYAFVLRHGFAFQFSSFGGEGEAPFDERVKAFKSLLQRFEYRPLYQVPDKPGLCIPHGFIADDGQGHFDAEVSYRYADSPGVIYTLASGIEGEQNFRANSPTLEAAARSSVAGLMGAVHGRKLKALGPKQVSIGARAGVMGGIVSTEGVPGYSVYAGTSGWTGSRILPHISLNMRSFDRATVPDELKVDPPAFEQSMQRYEQTLNSIRTRANAVDPKAAGAAQ
jgi:hypothetical protein